MKMVSKLYNNKLLMAHTQNLAKEQRINIKEGNKESLRCNDHLLHRRGWFGFFNDRYNITWEYCTGLDLGFRMAMDPSEKEAHICFRLLFVTLYLTFQGFVPKKFFPKGYEEKQIQLHFHHYALWVDLWTPTDSWRKGQRSYSMHFDDIFLGKTKYHKDVLSHDEGKLTLPEKKYDINYELGTQTWKRSRWFTKKISYVEAECKEGIPIPGKGENSWDCGDDLIYSTSGEGKNISVGRMALYNAVKRRREKYGSGMDMYLGIQA